MKHAYNNCFKFFDNSNICIISGLVHIFVFSLEDSDFPDSSSSHAKQFGIIS